MPDRYGTECLGCGETMSPWNSAWDGYCTFQCLLTHVAETPKGSAPITCSAP